MAFECLILCTRDGGRFRRLYTQPEDTTGGEGQRSRAATVCVRLLIGSRRGRYEHIRAPQSTPLGLQRLPVTKGL